MKEGLQLINVLPDALKELMLKYHGINYTFDICHTDVEGGYGSRVSWVFAISMYSKCCSNCGYHSLFNADDSYSHCNRHVYGEKKYETVFEYFDDGGESLVNFEEVLNRYIESIPYDNPLANWKNVLADSKGGYKEIEYYNEAYERAKQKHIEYEKRKKDEFLLP